MTRGPEIINREEGQRRIVVMSNVRGRDLGSFVAEVRARKSTRDIAFRPAISSSTADSSKIRSAPRGGSMLIVPIAIGLIFVLLYFTFGSVPEALLVVGNIPFALVGGIAALWIRGMNLNLSASIGFIALFGVAMLNGVVLVSSDQPIVRSGLSEPREPCSQAPGAGCGRY